MVMVVVVVVMGWLRDMLELRLLLWLLLGRTHQIMLMRAL
jgi:hypothetical protein